MSNAIDDMTLASPVQVFQILSKGKLTLALAVALALIAGATYVFVIADDVYTATGRLMIEAAPNIYPSSPASPETGSVEESVVISQSEALLSRDLIVSVYQGLEGEGLIDPPQSKEHRSVLLGGGAQEENQYEAAIAQLRDAFGVAVVDNSHVVVATFADRKPARAERALAILFQEYLHREVERRGAANRAARVQYESRLETLKYELETANRRITEEASGSELYIAGGSTVLSNTIQAAINQLNDLQRQITDISGQIKVGSEAAEREDWSEAARTIDTPTMQKLLQSEVQIELDARVGTSGNHTELYPVNMAMKGKIAALRALIKQEMQHAIQVMKENRDQLSAQARELEARLSTLKTSSDREFKGAVMLEQLEKNAAALREMHGVVLQRLYDTEVSPSPNAWVMEAPAASPRPTSPRVGVTFAAAGVFGLVCGALLVLWRDTRKRTANAALEFGTALELPAFWSLPKARSPVLLEGEGAGSGKNPAARQWRETLRAIGYKLAQKESRGGGVSVAVISAQPREGKTMLALALARLLANDGYRVLLIDGDLRKPDIHNFMGGGFSGSLRTILRDTTDWEDLVQSDPSSGLHFIAPTEPTLPPTGIFREGRMRKFLDVVSRRYDFTIIDTSPLLRVADGMVIMEYVDGGIFVNSERTSTVEVRETLQRSGFPIQKIEGVVRMGRRGDALSYPGY